MLGGALGVPQAATAAPTLSSKMAEAATVSKQIDTINARLDTANDNYYTAQQKLYKARSDQQSNQAKLNKTRSRLKVVQSHLDDRANEMYRSGPTGFASVLFGATDFQQFAQLWDFLGQLNQQDAASTVELKQLRDQTTSLQTKLNANEKQAQASVNNMKQIKDGVARDKADMQSKLAGISSEIDAYRAQQAADSLAASVRLSNSLSYMSSGKQFPKPSYQPNGNVVDIAKRYLGAPYVWAASGPNSFDCSGFTSFVYRQVGISLPHSSRAQINCGARVSRGDLQPGDLVFFGSPIHHVGLYVGGGQMIDAPYTGANVRYDSVFTGSYSGACRPR